MKEKEPITVGASIAFGSLSPGAYFTNLPAGASVRVEGSHEEFVTATVSTPGIEEVYFVAKDPNNPDPFAYRLEILSIVRLEKGWWAYQFLQLYAAPFRLAWFLASPLRAFFGFLYRDWRCYRRMLDAYCSRNPRFRMVNESAEASE